MYLKEQLELIEQQQFQFNMKRLLDAYAKEDALLADIHSLYVEYYASLSAPLGESRARHAASLCKWQRKLLNHEKSAKYVASASVQEARARLDEQIGSLERQLGSLDNHIDTLEAEHHEARVALAARLLDKMLRVDKPRVLPTCNVQMLSAVHEALVHARLERLESQIEHDKYHAYSRQLRVCERSRRLGQSSLAGGTKTETTRLAQETRLVQLRFHVCNEEENMLKRQLNKLKSAAAANSAEACAAKLKTTCEAIEQFDRNLVAELRSAYAHAFDAYLSEFGMRATLDDNGAAIRLDSHRECSANNNTSGAKLREEDEEDEDEYDDSKFHDTVEDLECLVDEAIEAEQKRLAEIDRLKKRILAVSSKKSSLRLLQVSLHTTTKLRGSFRSYIILFTFCLFRLEYRTSSTSANESECSSSRSRRKRRRRRKMRTKAATSSRTRNTCHS